MPPSIARALCLGLALTAAGGPARASGGLWCTIDDADLKMTIESGVTRGMGGPFFNFRASAEVLAKNVAPDFAKLTLDGNLVHSWIDRDETRLLLYTERHGDKPFGSMEITIETMGDRDEGDIPGKYEVNYFEAERQKGEDDGFIRLTGDVTCGGE
jgi:hypothetical protein